tara:strand:+ start:2546 stop:3310 length:765 start_codon:yes stop_codon:yes gene_type:complete
MKKIISSNIYLLGDASNRIDDILPWKLIEDIPKLFEDKKLNKMKNPIIKDVVINQDNGPVVIDITATIEPYTILNGPVYIGSNVLIKSHSNISNSIIEDNCKVKGEIHSSIFQPFSNKAHDGFIGHSFIGSWVNLGAGTTTSNLKNNYSSVSVKWNGDLVDTESIFFGAVIGEHVKTSIGTNLNTATVIEMGSNVVSQSFPPRHIPAFSLFYKDKLMKIKFDDFCDTVEKAMKRRDKTLSSSEKEVLSSIYKNC